MTGNNFKDNCPPLNVLLTETLMLQDCLYKKFYFINQQMKKRQKLKGCAWKSIYHFESKLQVLLNIPGHDIKNDCLHKKKIYIFDPNFVFIKKVYCHNI